MGIWLDAGGPNKFRMISLRTERLATKTKGSADNASAMGGIRICDAGTSIQKPGVSRPISGAQRGFQLSDAIRGWKHLGPCRRFRQPEIRRCARRPAAVAAVLLVRDIARSTSTFSGNAAVGVTSRQTAAQASASRRFSSTCCGLTPNGARPETLPPTPPEQSPAAEGCGAEGRQLAQWP